mmetsp:Transcript_46259/g.86371  ORF Transcript_46259/g.86371 Transcript_46259/m.86371 type:complete len:205 (-) Transcript_46259:762-1376(-)
MTHAVHLGSVHPEGELQGLEARPDAPLELRDVFHPEPVDAWLKMNWQEPLLRPSDEALTALADPAAHGLQARVRRLRVLVRRRWRGLSTLLRRSLCRGRGALVQGIQVRLPLVPEVNRPAEDLLGILDPEALLVHADLQAPSDLRRHHGLLCVDQANDRLGKCLALDAFQLRPSPRSVHRRRRLPLLLVLGIRCCKLVCCLFFQ